MGLVPLTSFPCAVIHDGILYEVNILPLKDPAKEFPEQFHIMRGSHRFADIHFGTAGWELIRSQEDEIDPKVIQLIGDFIQAHYE